MIHFSEQKISELRKFNLNDPQKNKKTNLRLSKFKIKFKIYVTKCINIYLLSQVFNRRSPLMNFLEYNNVKILLNITYVLLLICRLSLLVVPFFT